MPSTVQNLAIIYARMINTDAEKWINFLTTFSIHNRIALKAVLDKWLLHQALFRGRCTKNCTFLALTKLFKSKDKSLSKLLVVGYNPSHDNIGSGTSFHIFI